MCASPLRAYLVRGASIPRRESKALAARRELLHGPAVAVRVREEDERAPVEVLDLADLDTAPGELGVRRFDVVDDQLQSLGGPGLRVATESGADRDRGWRARWGQLDEPHLVADAMVLVGDESGLLAVERLGAIDVRDRHVDQFEAVVHGDNEHTIAEMGQLESFNPATGELVGTVETITPDQVQGVVDDVAEIQPFWGQLSLTDRGRYMRRAADVLLEEIDEVAELLTREQGKPRTESYTMELLPTVDLLHWIADEAPVILADEKVPYPQLFLKTKRSFFSYEPLGVIGVISPWNYPWSIPFGEVAIALMAGNGVVLKPASLTPKLGERIRQTFEKAGLPEGLVRDVHGGGAVGQALAESSADKIFFTGSVEVGRIVGEACAKQLKGCVLELGGKDPQIVCADADLANAV